MRILTLLFWISFIKVLMATDDSDFILSEIHPHPSQTGQQGWIEVQRMASTSLTISSIEISGYEGRQKKKRFQIRQAVPSLVWAPESFLLIGASLDLELGRCLLAPVIVVEDGTFTLQKQGAQTLCLRFNDGPVRCEYIEGDEKKIPQGVSLFPSRFLSYPDNQEEKWHSELCELSSGLYATPGLPPLACQSIAYFEEDIFGKCGAEKELLGPQIYGGFKPQGASPQITAFEVSYEPVQKALQVEFQIQSPHRADLLDVSLCCTSKAVVGLCKLLKTHIPYQVGQGIATTQLALPLAESCDGLQLRASNLFGHELRSEIVLWPKNGSPGPVDVLIQTENAGTLTMSIQTANLAHGLYNFRLLGFNTSGAIHPVSAGLIQVNATPFSKIIFQMPKADVQLMNSMVLYLENERGIIEQHAFMNTLVRKSEP